MTMRGTISSARQAGGRALFTPLAGLRRGFRNTPALLSFALIERRQRQARHGPGPHQPPAEDTSPS
jgi:hypothetical protein